MSFYVELFTGIAIILGVLGATIGLPFAIIILIDFLSPKFESHSCAYSTCYAPIHWYNRKMKRPAWYWKSSQSYIHKSCWPHVRFEREKA